MTLAGNLSQLQNKGGLGRAPRKLALPRFSRPSKKREMKKPASRPGNRKATAAARRCHYNVTPFPASSRVISSCSAFNEKAMIFLSSYVMSARFHTNHRIFTSTLRARQFSTGTFFLYIFLSHFQIFNRAFQIRSDTGA
jgi:hypothetical protein